MSIFLRNPLLVKVGFLVLIFLLISTVLIVNFTPQETYEIGEKSPKDIKSPRLTKYIDIDETEKLRQEKIKSVPKYYQEDPSVIINIEDQLNNIFEKIKTTSSKNWDITKKIEYLKKADIPLSTSAIEYALHLSTHKFSSIKYTAFDILKDVLSEKIRSDVPADLEKAKISIRKKVEGKLFSDKQKLIILEVCVALVKPNYIYDEKETELQKGKLLRNLKPVEKTILPGEVILPKGKIITQQDRVKLSAAGIIAPRINISLILHILLLNIVFFFTLLYSITTLNKDNKIDEKMVFLIGVVVLLGIIFSKLLGLISSGYLSILPIVSTSQILIIFTNPVIAILTSVVLGLYNGIILNNELKFAAISILSCFVGIVSVKNLHRRQDIVLAGIFVSVVQILSILSFSIMFGENVLTTLINIGMGIANGIGSSILTIGCIYFLERPFGIVSPLRLLELISANEPLISRLMIEAPGTYNHSVYVGNLAENAATLIGANPLLTRVGSYYHDIGKIKRPYFFVENQINIENPHESMSPALSVSIIKAHVADGVEIARQHKLPHQIIDIIAQHHGTSLISYFFNLASEENKDLQEAHFRYDSKKPQTKEAVLVMLADATEAAARSISSPTPEKIRATVEKIIRERVEDGQLDESDVTFKDINKIIDSFCHILEGMFHLRVEYPEKTQENVEKNV